MSKNKEYIRHFNSPEEYREYLLTIPKALHCRDNDSSGWAGGSWEHVIDKLWHGDTKCLAQAEKIIDQMKDANVFTQNLPVLESAVVGYVPNVVASIAGLPKSMYRYDDSDLESTTTPLTIYIETTVSGGVGLKEMTARGVCALAFALAMSAIRPVDATTDNGHLFYNGVALLTGLMFPWLKFEEVKPEIKDEK